EGCDCDMGRAGTWRGLVDPIDKKFGLSAPKKRPGSVAIGAAQSGMVVFVFTKLHTARLPEVGNTSRGCDVRAAFTRPEARADRGCARGPGQEVPHTEAEADNGSLASPRAGVPRAKTLPALTRGCRAGSGQVSWR